VKQGGKRGNGISFAIRGNSKKEKRQGWWRSHRNVREGSNVTERKIRVRGTKRKKVDWEGFGRKNQIRER